MERKNKRVSQDGKYILPPTSAIYEALGWNYGFQIT